MAGVARRGQSVSAGVFEIQRNEPTGVRNEANAVIL